MKYILSFILIGGLIYGSYYYINGEKKEIQVAAPLENQDNVISYVSKNISKLSPQKEVLGGTFYVTNITLDAGEGTVEYEDGHNAYVANFAYIIKNGQVEIIRFVIVE